MDAAASERADQALSRYVKGGRTLSDIGIEFAYLRQERGLNQQALAQRATLSLEAVQAMESGRRLPIEREFALLAAGLKLTAGRLAEILNLSVLPHRA